MNDITTLDAGSPSRQTKLRVGCQVSLRKGSDAAASLGLRDDANSRSVSTA